MKAKSTLKRAATLLIAASLSLAIAPFAEAQAQPAAAPSDAVKEVARQRYEDGVKAFDSGKFEDARLAFVQAHQLMQAPGILLNLGLSELRTNRPVEAGNHLLQFVREYKEATPEQKANAIASIEECKRRAALISIQVDQPGADVSIDGTLVGKSPLADPVFVEPGMRTVFASLAGKNAMAKTEAKKGSVASAMVQFNPTAAPTPAQPPTTQPGQPTAQPGQPTAQPQPGQFQPGQTQPGQFQPGAPGQPPQGYMMPQPPPDQGGKQSFGDWYVSKPLAWVGTGVTAVGLGLGIGFTIAAAGTSSDADTLAATIRSEARKDNLSGAPCGSEDADSTSADRYPGPCSALRDTLAIHDANVAVAVVGWVVGGLAAAGTVTYIMVDYVLADDVSADKQGGTSTQLGIVPVLSADTQGVQVIGTF